jgi:3-oxoacyl-[acyl-carrier-protein] synthase-3
LGLIDEYLRTDGDGRPSLKINAGGSLLPASRETVANNQHVVIQDGKTVFRFAITKMADVTEKILHRINLSGDDINWLVPHQANYRIIEATARRLQLPDNKVMKNIHKYGNTTSATLPLCLQDYEKRLKKGDNLVFTTFGGGFTWGSFIS